MDSADELRDAGSDLVTHAARLVRAIRRAIPQQTGIRVLSLLDEHGALGVTQLAEMDRCSQPTMSGTVNVLLEQGLVLKAPHPDDARSTLVSLTASGRRTLGDYRKQSGALVADRLTTHGQHTAEDVAIAVSVMRAVLAPEPDEAQEGIS
ncbi:MarR family winged helix-turn-helix transcriptional regulator [Nocardioides terrisoli]|uniref:MarR family winged helix-turn-helix transcriptional regulator n=1 Tax=Nocardioides terrisoli TaxID=3388267 RepID=UPI00287B9D96|nr:MarR family transcriptional regulator [Nocardioides marmorisolisilvae]